MRAVLPCALVIVCVDVDDRAAETVAACVGFHDWADATSAREAVARTPGPPAEYQPGEFYRRELPHVLAALAAIAVTPHTIVVDGYAWLGPERPGLGAHLHAALAGAIPIVGVAKRPFEGATTAVPILRGTSHQPLYITTVGTDLAAAAQAVRTMHGPHRLPTLIKRVDRLARDA